QRGRLPRCSRAPPTAERAAEQRLRSREIAITPRRRRQRAVRIACRRDEPARARSVAAGREQRLPQQKLRLRAEAGLLDLRRDGALEGRNGATWIAGSKVRRTERDERRFGERMAVALVRELDRSLQRAEGLVGPSELDERSPDGCERER